MILKSWEEQTNCTKNSLEIMAFLNSLQQLETMHVGFGRFYISVNPKRGGQYFWE